ncbi:MAG: hypothetical protein GY720_12605 [bacterium]|nr:hypothetical protein [bacterium]
MALTFVGLAGWFFLAARRSETASAAGAVTTPGVEGSAVSLPLRQRVRHAFSSGRPKVPGPGLWHRIRMGLTRSSNGTGTANHASRVSLAARWRSTEAARSLKARRESRAVQRRIKERRSGH